VQVPPVRGLDTPYCSPGWAQLAATRDRLKTLSGEMVVGGMAQRDMAAALEKALGQFVRSQSAIRTMTDTLSQAYAAFRTRDLSGSEGASRCMDTVYEPLRRWGRKTGVLCVGGSWVDGRKVLRTRSTANSASFERCRAVLRALTMRGRQTPVTIPTDGAAGLIKAVDFVWPTALRMRCWFHKRQPLRQQVPPQAWPAFKAWVADRRDAPTFAEGQRRFRALIAQYQAPCPDACRCLADDAEASLNHLKGPLRQRQYVRTSHVAERAFAEERRRTKVMPHLGDEASRVKRVVAVLIRVRERWGKKQESAFAQHQMRSLRHA
jgi:putative transposase